MHIKYLAFLSIFFVNVVIHTTRCSTYVIYVDAFFPPHPPLSLFLSLPLPHLLSLKRIKRSGGFITWNSLGQPNVNGRLAMTRSIGDFDLKNMGVIAEPETKKISVSPAHFHFKLRAFAISTFEAFSCVLLNKCGFY